MDYVVGVIFFLANGEGLKSFCWKGICLFPPFLLSSVLFKALCAAVAFGSCVAMNNHRYAICSMVVSHIRDVQETLTSVGKVLLYGSRDNPISLHCFSCPSLVRLVLQWSKLCLSILLVVTGDLS